MDRWNFSEFFHVCGLRPALGIAAKTDAYGELPRNRPENPQRI